MKPSPVQLLQLFFEKVSIEVDGEHAPEEQPNPLTNPFRFEGVTLRTSVGIGEPEHPTEDESVYQLNLKVVVDNKPSKSRPGQKFCPYKLDVEAVAWVRLHQRAEKLGPLRDLALVNGAALAWSAIREQVAVTTGRMPFGSICLPTVHFQDLRSDAKPSKAKKPVPQVAEQNSE